MPFSRSRYGTLAKYRRYKRLVARLKRRRGIRSPHAVARASIYGKGK